MPVIVATIDPPITSTSSRRWNLQYPNYEKSLQRIVLPGTVADSGPTAKDPWYRLKVAASIEEYKPWFHDLRGETRVGLGRSLC